MVGCNVELWSVGRSVGRSVGFLFGWLLVVWLTGCLAVWLINRLLCWLHDLIASLIDCSRQVRIALDEKRLRVAVAASDGRGLDAVLVDGLLCGSVRPPSDQDDIDWEMKDVDVHGDKDFAAKTSVIATGLARAVCVTMRKEPMGMGVIHWWKTVMRGDTEIDVMAIPDRRGASMSTSSADRTRALQDSWALAHEQFKARCKQRQKIDVDF